MKLYIRRCEAVALLTADKSNFYRLTTIKFEGIKKRLTSLPIQYGELICFSDGYQDDG